MYLLMVARIFRLKLIDVLYVIFGITFQQRTAARDLQPWEKGRGAIFALEYPSEFLTPHWKIL